MDGGDGEVHCGRTRDELLNSIYGKQIAVHQELLSSFGVEVSFGDDIEIWDRVDAMETIWAAVYKTGQAFAKEFGFETPQEAFMTMFGDSSTITILNDVSGICEEGRAGCNLGSFADGGSNIYISSAGIMGQATFDNDGLPNAGENINPEHLVVHEFAHYLTNPLSNPFNGDPDTFNFSQHPRGRLRDRALERLQEEGAINIGRSSAASEQTADIITNWVYGTDFGRANRTVNNFMESIAIACVDAGGCGR